MTAIIGKSASELSTCRSLSTHPTVSLKRFNRFIIAQVQNGTVPVQSTFDNGMINKLHNLGDASSQMLETAGIKTVPQLRALGTAAAYVAVKRAGCTPSLNLLWAIERALTDRDWKEVAKSDRLSLLTQVEELEKSKWD